MRFPRRWTLTTLLAAFALVVLASPSPALVADDWPAYLYNAGHSSYNAAATTITTANAASITRYWQFKAAGPTMSGQPGPAFYASPTVYQGRVYIGANTGVFYALDLATKRVVWSKFLGYVPGQTCGKRGITATATVAPDPVSGQLTVYVAGGDGYMYALNADTGAQVWRSVVGLKSPTQNDYYNWGSPAVANGNVYYGITSQCDNPLVRGGIIGFNQATGATLGTYYSMAAGHRGGGVWSSVAVSAEGDVFATTGTGRRDDAESIVRVNGTTMAREDGWMVPTAEAVADSDFGASPTIFTATLNGVPTEMVGACNKNGIFYALKANDFSGGPVWEFQASTGTRFGQSSCLASAIWDGQRLFVSASPTKVGGTSYLGAIRQLDPATGHVIWEKGLGGVILGTPTLDGAGVIAAGTYNGSGTPNSVYLLDSSNGQVLKTIGMAGSKVFAQPVFADGYLFIASTASGLQVFKP